MKFEPIRYRESSVELYGKRGIRWHDTVVLYRLMGQDPVRPTHSDSDRLSTMALDHIFRNVGTQDCWKVASIFDAVLSRVSQDIPTLRSIWVVTDNSRNYQNDLVPVIAPFISAAHGLTLNGLIHPETARGKSLVDAHFSIAMRHVHRYVRETESAVCI